MSAAAQLVEKAQAASVRLWIEGDRVMVRGPREALPLLEELRAHRDEVREHLAELVAEGERLLEHFERKGIRLRLGGDDHSLTDGGGRIHSRRMQLDDFAQLVKGQDAIRAALRARDGRATL